MPVEAAWAQWWIIKSGPYTRVAPTAPSRRSAQTSGWPSGTASVALRTARIVAGSSWADMTRLTAAAVSQPRAPEETIASIQAITSGRTGDPVSGAGAQSTPSNWCSTPVLAKLQQSSP